VKLLQKIRTAKDLSRNHLLSLINDYKTRGEEQFFILADTELAPKPRRHASARTPSTDDAILLDLKKLQKKTMKVESFIGAVINMAAQQQLRFKAGARPTSMPKLIQYFRSNASEAQLLAIANEVFRENTRAHTTLRNKEPEAAFRSENG
jgi:hypothetical protein